MIMFRLKFIQADAQLLISVRLIYWYRMFSLNIFMYAELDSRQSLSEFYSGFAFSLARKLI